MTDPSSPVVDPPPARRHAPSIILFLVVALGLLATDLLSKQLAFRHVAGAPVRLTGNPAADKQAIPPHHAVVVVPKVLALQLTLNEGAVFGMGQGRRWLFVLISVAAIGVIGLIFSRSSAGHWALHVPLAMILAGALGNLYDRIVYSAVRDMCKLFPDVHLPFGWQWPGDPANASLREVYPWIFNIADVALVLGVLWLIFFGQRKAQKADADKD